MQAEYFDRPGLPVAERVAAFQELDRINRLFQFSHPFASNVPVWLGKERCARLEILDVGAGSGLLGETLSAWAAKRGWDWRFTNLDSNPLPSLKTVRAKSLVGSALELPFEENSFDLVVASQMTHHLSDPEVVQHWREAWRVTRDGIFICDLHRNAGLYGMLWLTMGLLRTSRELREDGLISVKRGFHRREWRDLAARAGISDARVWLYCGTRIVLQARKGTPRNSLVAPPAQPTP